MRVLISDNLAPVGVEILIEAGLEVDVKTGMSPDELKAVIGDYDGLVIRSATKVTTDLLESASRLRVVGRAGIGLDNVDIPAASQKGVVVMNAPDGNANERGSYLTGVDGSGNRLFQLYLVNTSTANDATEGQRIAYIDSSGAEQFIGAAGDLNTTGSFTGTWDPSIMKTVSVDVGASSYSISLGGSSLASGIAFRDASASGLASIQLATNSRFTSGWIDNLEVTTVSSPSDYDTWASIYEVSPGDLSDPSGDFDKDGLTNEEERIWGLDPTSASSVSPIQGGVDVGGVSSFTYTRRAASLTGLTYTIRTSTDLSIWTDDTGAMQDAGAGPDASGVETVAVTLSASPVDGRLFVRVKAE